MKGLFAIAGSQLRKVGRLTPSESLTPTYFIRDDGPSEPLFATDSLETLHFTVRVLLAGKFALCRSLKDYQTCVDAGRVYWKLCTVASQQEQRLRRSVEDPLTMTLKGSKFTLRTWDKDSGWAEAAVNQHEEELFRSWIFDAHDSEQRLRQVLTCTPLSQNQTTMASAFLSKRTITDVLWQWRNESRRPSLMFAVDDDGPSAQKRS